MEIIDSHCHLFLEEFQDPPPNCGGQASGPESSGSSALSPQKAPSRESAGEFEGAGENSPERGPSPAHMGLELQGVLERARQNGVAAIINVALDVESTFAVLAAHSRAPWLHPTAGWHPSSAAKLKESDLEKLDELSKRPEIAAFGEIGLDYFRRPEEAGAQKKALEGLLRVAASCGKPVIIHCRDAFDDLAAILGKERSRLKGVLLHCFSGSAEQARIACDLGCHLSFAGPITFPKAGELRRALAAAPRDALMIETDAPYLAPVPFRGKRNEPSYLVHHLEAMAAVLEISVSEAAALTSKNARLFFGLDERAFSA